MNKDLREYINKHGNEKISNSHLMFINGLMRKNGVIDFGILYKLSNKIYNSIKNKENKTLNEVIDLFNKK